MMKIQINYDKNIRGSDKFESFASDKIGRSLKRFGDRITRTEVFMSDQNAQRVSQDDVQCKIEVRISDFQPVTVTGKGNSREMALTDAITKIKAALDTLTGKQNTR